MVKVKVLSSFSYYDDPVWADEKQTKLAERQKQHHLVAGKEAEVPSDRVEEFVGKGLVEEV